jgi:hypothetical protein
LPEEEAISSSLWLDAATWVSSAAKANRIGYTLCMSPELDTDFRGEMFRAQRQMTLADARAFLTEQKIANIGTVDAHGWPYVVPLAFIYARTDVHPNDVQLNDVQGNDVHLNDELWFHTGWHQGHLFHNLKQNSKVCLEVAGIGKLTPVIDGFACDSSLLYSSVIVFGTAQVIDDRDKKTWFFDRMVEKYGDPSLQFKPGYPMLDRIILFRMAMERMTGKRNSGMAH